MKKKYICFVLAMIMVSLLVCPAYAAEMSTGWVLVGGAEYITHGDNIYYPVDFPYANFVDYNLDWEYYDLEFSNQKMAQLYAESFILVTEGVEDIVIEVELYKNHEYYDSLVYVEEAYYDEFVQLREGNASSYVVENNNLEYITVTNNQFDAWSNDDRKTMVGDDVYGYDWYYIYACDSSGAFMHEIGLVLHDYFDDEMYLLRYDECDPICFDEYGSFIGNDLESFAIYELDNDALSAQIAQSYDYYVEDDFDLSMNSDVGIVIAAVFCSIVFGLLPLAVMTFAAVMIVKCKDKKYRKPFIVLLSGAAAVLVAFVIIFAFIAMM